MSDTKQEKPSRKFRLLDLLVILLCIIGAAYFFNQFRLDMSRKEDPVGTIIISNNVVQRLMAKRMTWERLAVYSPIYAGDQIRTADLSNATLYIERNSVDLDEKTVIRIRRSPNEEDTILLYLDEGNLVLSTGDGAGKIILNIMGRLVEAEPQTVLSASTDKDGAVVRVIEGIAILSGEKGEKREIVSGSMLALDPSGAERAPPAVSTVTEQSGDVPPEPVLLPEPLNRLPVDGYRIGIEQLKESSRLAFTWSAVVGANAYIFTLFQDTSGVRRQIIRVPPEDRRNWTLENLSALGSGTFAWQVEAVSMDPAGTIERRGRIGEHYFIIDIPQPGQIRIEDQGILYGY